MSISVAKWTFFLSLCGSRISFFFAPNFFHSKFHSGIFSSFFRSLSTTAFWIRNLQHWWPRNKLLHQIVMCHRSKSFSCNAIFMFFRSEKILLVVSVIQEIPQNTQKNCFFELFLAAISGFATTLEMLLGCLLHGMGGATGLSSFLLTFLRISRYSSSSGS